MMAVIMTTVMMFSLSACTDAGKGTQTDERQEINQRTQSTGGPSEQEAAGSKEADENTSETGNTTAKKGTGKPLVVYFSQSGHLDSMAHWIADETGGDLYRVTAADPYPEDYNDTADRAKQEQEDGVRPEIVVDIAEERMKQYDTVFFGFPVWWYDLPMPMWTFLENYDFSGKTIIPFFSHEGSSNGANALPTVTKLAAGATVRSDDALSIRGGNVDGAESEVREWVRNLEY